MVDRGLVQGRLLPVVHLKASLLGKQLTRFQRRDQYVFARRRLDGGISRGSIVASRKGPVRCFPPQCMLSGVLGAGLGAAKVVEIETLNGVGVLETGARDRLKRILVRVIMEGRERKVVQVVRKVDSVKVVITVKVMMRLNLRERGHRG